MLFSNSCYYFKATVFLLLLIFQLHFTSCSDAVNPKKKENANGFVKTRGFNMYYEIHGAGEPLLIIHGNGGSSQDFFNQTPFFSKNYKVILADSRAQGKSVDANDSLSYEMMADDFNALLDTLHMDSCYVLGWSDGGINGLLLAIRHPEKVKKLAVTGANLQNDTSALDPFIYKWGIHFNDSLKSLVQTPEVKNEYKLASLEPHITTAELNKITCPTLVMGGDHDIILPEHTLLIAQSIPKSYLWILPNSGHGTLIDYKDQFNEIVNDFFRKSYRNIEGWERVR